MNRTPSRTEPAGRAASARGFTLAELLVVLAIIGIAVAVAIPLTVETMRAAKIRAATDQFAMDLRAARMIAVTKRATLDFTVAAAPSNYYQYTDNQGRVRRIEMPSGVRITSSTSPIQFQLNGSLTSAATTVIEIDLTSDTVERWTVDTNILGVPKTTRERIAS